MYNSFYLDMKLLLSFVLTCFSFITRLFHCNTSCSLFPPVDPRSYHISCFCLVSRGTCIRLSRNWPLNAPSTSCYLRTAVAKERLSSQPWAVGLGKSSTVNKKRNDLQFVVFTPFLPSSSPFWHALFSSKRTTVNTLHPGCCSNPVSTWDK